MNAATAVEAQSFYNNGIEQLSKVHHGDEAAMTALLVGLVMEQNVVLFGESAGGKTTLAAASARLVHEIGPENTASIPAQHDLPAIQLVGGGTTLERTIVKDGNATTERVTTAVDPIIKPETMHIFADELPRISPLAMQGLLPTLETKVLNTSAGAVELPDLCSVVATMNPVRRGQHNSPISFAMASRFEIGARVGGYNLSREERAVRLNAIMFGTLVKADQVTPVVNADRLRAMKQTATSTPVVKEMQSRLISLALNVGDVIHDQQIMEDEPRIGLQITSIAKALALMTNKKSVVGDEEANKAAMYVASARLGMLRDLKPGQYDEAMAHVIAG
ncbi:AAA family ATPase [Polaromonas sp.]|nr:AAA family ATPase [Candidatus Saccharibacteria bacterium]